MVVTTYVVVPEVEVVSKGEVIPEVEVGPEVGEVTRTQTSQDKKTRPSP